MWMTLRPFLAALVAAAVAAAAGVATSGCRAANAEVVRAVDPALARTENDRAADLMADGKYAEAEAPLRRALEADPLFGPARNNLGLVHFRADGPDSLYKAAWEFEAAAKLMPDRPEPRNNLGLVFERAGQLPRAIDAYARARGLAPDNAEYLGNLARVRVRRGDRDDETRRLLEELVLKDGRPRWTDWARLNLIRLKDANPENAVAPTTSPSVPWISR